ncbi:MAG: tetratricopeptide repeat protein [Planctomycetota bacterium]
MSYLLETLGRGLLVELLAAFENQLPGSSDEDHHELHQRRLASPSSADLAIRYGVSCLRRMHLAEARQAFESALELTSTSPQPALGLACVHDQLDQPRQTLRYLSIAQAHDPDDPAIAFAIGFCHERQGNQTAAIASYRRSVELCPQLRNAHERLAAIAIHDGDWREAVSCYEQLAEFEPGNLDVLLVLANLYLQCNRTSAAADRYQDTLLIEPELSDDSLGHADELLDEGRIQEAIETLERLVRKYPDVAPFHIHLGDLYAKAGQDPRAMAEYRLALEMQPDLLEATVKLGTQHLRQGHYVDAAQTFNRAVELNDRLMLAFVGLGISQHAAGQEHEALATLDLAVSLEPSTTLLFAETARLHLKSESLNQDSASVGYQHDTDDEADEADFLAESIRRHRQALASSPNYPDLYYRYGLLLRQAGEHEEAIQAFKNAVEMNPNYTKALVKLGVCLKETGQTDEAIDIFRRALTLDSQYVDVHYQLGLLFAQRNRFELAVEEFEHAVAGNQQNLKFRANLALALQNIGMMDRAAATWHSICELTRDPGHRISTRDRITRDIPRD